MSRFRLIINNLFSFEFAFTAFLLAGTYKGDPRLESFPIDLTLFFFIVSLFIMLWIYMQNTCMSKVSLQAIAAFYAFALWGLFTIYFTPSEIYSKEKILRLCFLTGWSFIGAALVVSSNIVRIERFLNIFCIYAVIMSFEALYNYFNGEGRFVTAFGSNYLALGRVAGTACIILVIRLLFTKKIPRANLLIVLISILIIALYTSGSRGPLLSVIVALLFVFISVFDINNGFVMFKNYWNKILLVSILVIGLSLGLYSNGLLDTTTERLALLLNIYDMGDSASTRISLYNDAISLWIDNPVWGVGIGGFPILAGYSDERVYPHNLVLEVLVEMGLIGFILLFVFFQFCVTTFNNVYKSTKTPTLLVLQTIFIVSLLNAMVSGDINDNRLLFSCTGLLTLGSTNKERDEHFSEHI